MNKRYKGSPEVLARVYRVDHNGEEWECGDKVVGLDVATDQHCTEGIVKIDVRDFRKSGENLVIEIELPELASALTLATLWSSHEK